MLKIIRKQMNKKGFTLIELVVVIAILAILAAIAVPQLLGFQDRAREQADKQTAVQIRNALSLLHANGELTVAVLGTVTYTAGTDAFGVTGIIDTATGVAMLEPLLSGLTGGITIEGSKDIIVTISATGVVTVTSP